MNNDDIQHAQELLGYEFNDTKLLVQSLTHASLVDSRHDSNERLEFLGDAVLGIVVCEHLFRRFDGLLEGEMTKIKSMVVSRHSCAIIAESMGLGDLLRLGKGMSNRTHLPQSVLAAVYESLVGAIYIDGGLEAASEFIMSRMGSRVEHADRCGHQQNFKSVLQQTAQQRFDQTPQYVILDEKGPDHAKCFEVCVEIGARRFDSCWGPSKKQAEQDAALQALVELGLAERDDAGEVHLCSPDESAVTLEE